MKGRGEMRLKGRGEKHLKGRSEKRLKGRSWKAPEGPHGMITGRAGGDERVKSGVLLTLVL